MTSVRYVESWDGVLLASSGDSRTRVTSRPKSPIERHKELFEIKSYFRKFTFEISLILLILRHVHFYAGINSVVKSRGAWRGIDSPRNKYNRSSGILLCNPSVGRASPVNVAYNKSSVRARVASLSLSLSSRPFAGFIREIWGYCLIDRPWRGFFERERRGRGNF